MQFWSASLINFRILECELKILISVKRYFDDDGQVITSGSTTEENVKLFSTDVGTFAALDFVTRLLNNINRNEAATVIQRCYLRFKLRREIREKHLQHQHDIGMLELTRMDHNDEYERIQAMREKRRNKKKEFDKAFVKACEDDKARIVRLRTPYIMEDITDHMRFWFREM